MIGPAPKWRGWLASGAASFARTCATPLPSTQNSPALSSQITAISSITVLYISQFTSGSSTRTGCWICRLRRKKCDENTPACSNCVSPNFECQEYGQKPAWMVGKENWQQVLDSEEAKAIRTSTEKAYGLRRKKNLLAVPWSPGVLVQGLKELGRPASGPASEPSSVPGTELDRTWSNCTQTLRECDYALDYQCIQTFIEVVFPIQWRFFDLNRQLGRQWILDLIIACEPVSSVLRHVDFVRIWSESREYKRPMQGHATSQSIVAVSPVRVVALHRKRSRHWNPGFDTAGSFSTCHKQRQAQTILKISSAD